MFGIIPDRRSHCVLRTKARGHRELVTVVGHSATIAAGEWITATGEWVNDRTHGQQFKARFLRTSAPTSTEGIEKYLSFGMIRGIGPVYARKLVRAFFQQVRNEGHVAGEAVELGDNELGAVDSAECERLFQLGPVGTLAAFDFDDLAQQRPVRHRGGRGRRVAPAVRPSEYGSLLLRRRFAKGRPVGSSAVSRCG